MNGAVSQGGKVNVNDILIGLIITLIISETLTLGCFRWGRGN